MRLGINSLGSSKKKSPQSIEEMAQPKNELEPDPFHSTPRFQCTVAPLSPCTPGSAVPLPVGLPDRGLIGSSGEELRSPPPFEAKEILKERGQRGGR